MLQFKDLGEEFLVVFEELDNKTDTLRSVTVKARSHGYAIINPADWRRSLIISVYFDVWSTPAPSKDGDTIEWREQWLFVERRNQWLKVVRIDNNSDNAVDMTVRIRAQ